MVAGMRSRNENGKQTKKKGKEKEQEGLMSLCVGETKKRENIRIRYSIAVSPYSGAKRRNDIRDVGL